VPIWRLYRGFKGKSFGNFPNLEDNRQYTHKEQKGREGEIIFVMFLFPLNSITGLFESVIKVVFKSVFYL
jgi:hypothetical protein